jgi:hypothetical protein
VVIQRQASWLLGKVDVERSASEDGRDDEGKVSDKH